MLATMSQFLADLDSDTRSALIGFTAAILGTLGGGLFTLVATIWSLRKQTQNIRLAEITRLEWSKRWDVIARTNEALSKTFWSLRRLSLPQGKVSSQEERETAERCQNELQQVLFSEGIFLPVEMEERVVHLAGDFFRINGTLRTYVDHLYSETLVNREESIEFLTPKKIRCTGALGDNGEVKARLDELQAEIRAYMSNPDHRFKPFVAADFNP